MSGGDWGSGGLGWSEVEKPAVSADSDGTQRTSRRFRVWDASPETVLTDPGAIHQDINNPIGLPGYNSNFPGFPSLKLDRYEVSNDKPIFDAVAYYSNDRRFIFPSNPNDTPNLALWSGSFETATFQLPFARLTVSEIASPGGEPVEIYGWQFEKQPVSETRMKFGRTVLNESNLAIGLQRIRENNNKLQNIGGVWYLFRAGNFRQPTPLSWEVTYSFILDEGTKKYAVADPSLVSQGLFLPPDDTVFPSLFGTSTWVRPPYCDIIVRQVATSPVPAGEISLLEFVPVCPFDVSANNGMGWQTLPGLGL